MRGCGASSEAGNPSPRRRGPARTRPGPWLQVRGAEKGKRKGEESGRAKAGRKRPGALLEGGGEPGSRGCPAAAPPAAGGVRRGSRSRSPRRCHFFPGAFFQAPRELAWGPSVLVRRPAAAPRAPPRPWLRAGGGRTRRKSWGAAPGAGRSRATRLQVRGVRSTRGRGGGGKGHERGPGGGGRGRTEGWAPWGRSGPALEGSGSLTSSPASRGPAPLGDERGREKGFSFLILTFGAEPEEIHTGLSTCQGRSPNYKFSMRTLNPGAAALDLVAQVMTSLWVSQRPVEDAPS